MSNLQERRAARMQYKKSAKKPLGGGSRFAAVEKSAKLGGAENPAAVAAAVGRKKYGNDKFQKLSLMGKRKAFRKVFK